MSEHADFLRAIIAAPADDGPRLVYADWLEEHAGEPERAEFIRAQCETAARWAAHAATPMVARERWHEHCDPTCPACANQKRERELINSIDWSRELGDLCVGWICENVSTMTRQDMSSFVFRRGFVDELALPWDEWTGQATALLAKLPVRRVRLTTWPWPDEYYAGDFAIVTRLAREWPSIEFELPAERSPWYDAEQVRMPPGGFAQEYQQESS